MAALFMRKVITLYWSLYDENTQELGWLLSTLVISSQITVIVEHEVRAIPLGSSCDMWSRFSSRGRRAEE